MYSVGTFIAQAIGVEVSHNIPLAWYELVIIGAAVISAVWVVWQKLVWPVILILRNIEILYPIIPKIDRIAKEFENGGESLKDRVIDLHASVTDLRHDFKEFKSEVTLDIDKLYTYQVEDNQYGESLESSEKYPGSEGGSGFRFPWTK